MTRPSAGTLSVQNHVRNPSKSEGTPMHDFAQFAGIETAFNDRVHRAE
jgi:hypothetical protein